MDASKKVQENGISVKEALKVEKLQEWIPPPINWIKVNVDVAVHKDQQVAGFGAVVRNSLGQVIAAAVKGTEIQGEVSFVEAQAVK